jgi:hypothetical protein
MGGCSSKIAPSGSISTSCKWEARNCGGVLQARQPSWGNHRVVGVGVTQQLLDVDVDVDVDVEAGRRRWSLYSRALAAQGELLWCCGESLSNGPALVRTERGAGSAHYAGLSQAAHAQTRQALGVAHANSVGAEEITCSSLYCLAGRPVLARQGPHRSRRRMHGMAEGDGRRATTRRCFSLAPSSENCIVQLLI